MDAIRKSKELMDGHKMKLFKLLLSFLGWALLCILTLGIGFLWLAPYVMLSLTTFYEDLKGDGIANKEPNDSSAAVAGA
ncbi:MAG TPA: DUF975 family protein, partial [Syntrophorhabdaceae bacterium]|nr:DUF975 family protein [Syntrophorhabdaceae bacterium]